MNAADRRCCAEFARRAALGFALALIVWIAVTGVLLLASEPVR